MPDAIPVPVTPAIDFSAFVGSDQMPSQLDTKYAERYKFTENPHWTHTELTLIWRTISVDLYQTAVQFAYLYCLPQNYPTKRRWVKDIHVKDKKDGSPIIYPGVWRMVNADFDAKKQGDPGVMITFRQGFARDLDFTEALRIQAVDLEADERYAMLVIPNVDPQYVNAICATIRATMNTLNLTPAVVNPVVQGETLTGNWEYALVKPEKQQDGSFFINIMLARSQFTILDFEHYGTPEQVNVIKLLGVPKRMAQLIINTYQVEGNSVNAGYGPTEGLTASTCDITIRQGVNTTFDVIVQTANTCDYTEVTRFAYGYTLAAAEAAIAAAMVARTVGETIHASVPSLMSNGKYSFEIRIRTSIASAQRFIVQIAEGETAEYVYAYNQRIPGFSNTDEPFIIPDTVFMALHSEQALQAGESFNVRSFVKNDDCTFSWHSAIENKLDGNTTAWPETIVGYVRQEKPGVWYGYIECKKYFAGAANRQAASSYAGKPHGPTVNVLSYTSGIDTSQITDVATYANWHVVHAATQLKTRDNYIIEALRVERSVRSFSLPEVG